MLGIAVGTAALIIALSIFNGLATFIEGLFSALDPDVKVVAARGSSFEYSEEVKKKLEGIPGVTIVSLTYEGKVGMQYYDKQAFAVIKGVDESFNKHNPIDSVDFLYEGEYEFGPKNGYPRAIMGSEVAARVGANINDEIEPIKVFVPLHKRKGRTLPVQTSYIFPSGYFSVQKEYDEKYVLVGLKAAQEIFNQEGRITAYEVGIKNLGQVDRVKADMEKALGEKFQVLTWYEQHKTLYQVMRNEKYVSYLILTLMLVIAAVNIVGSLTMIVLEKTRDIAVLKSMGTTVRTIRQIFFVEGLLVGGIGVSTGLGVGFLFGLIQQQFGVLKLQGGESFRVSAFPLEMQVGDFLLIAITVLTLSMLAAWYPSQKAAEVDVVEGLRR